MKLTPDFLDTVQPDAARRIEYRDDDEPGLIFRVTPIGVRSWSVRYRNAAGEQRRKTLGNYPTVGLARARILARKAKGEIADKVDIVGATKAAKAEAERQRLDRLDALAENYFADCRLGLHRARTLPKKPKIITVERQLYEKCIKPVFGSRAITSITRREIIDFVGRMTRVAASCGRKSQALMSQLFSYAVMREVVPANIALRVPVMLSEPRQRVLTDSELKMLWPVMVDPDGEGANLSPEMGLALRMLLATLQRSGQALRMKWDEIDFAERVWMCPADSMKKRRTHLVPLSALALQLLHEADQIIGDAVHVFASPRTGLAMRVDAASTAFERLTMKLGIADAQIHDFRRTGTTAMTSRLGIERFIAGKVLSHKRGDDNVTAQHYDMHDYLAEKRRALDAWAALLTEIVTGAKRTGNVVALAHAG